jgi:hypothetical protein
MSPASTGTAHKISPISLAIHVASRHSLVKYLRHSGVSVVAQSGKVFEAPLSMG